MIRIVLAALVAAGLIGLGWIVGIDQGRQEVPFVLTITGQVGETSLACDGCEFRYLNGRGEPGRALTLVCESGTSCHHIIGAAASRSFSPPRQIATLVPK